MLNGLDLDCQSAELNRNRLESPAGDGLFLRGSDHLTDRNRISDAGEDGIDCDDLLESSGVRILRKRGADPGPSAKAMIRVAALALVDLPSRGAAGAWESGSRADPECPRGGGSGRYLREPRGDPP